DSAACDEGQARTLFHELLQQLDNRYHHLVQANNLLDGPNYVFLRNDVKTLFEASPAHMAQIVSLCLAAERRIITSAKAGQDADCKLKSIDQQLGNYDYSFKAWQDEVKQLNGLPDLGYLMSSSEVLAEQVVSTLVEEELSRWRLRQQLACIGAPQDSSLYKLQTWFTLAADALNVQLQQLRKLQEFDQQSPPIDNMPALRTHALVVESQPCMLNSTHRPLIIKTGVRFALKTRFLVNVPSFSFMPKVTLVFDK
ncbi:hypothetical protein CRUP_025200, partial [Coryphaenoides rupestris]